MSRDGSTSWIAGACGVTYAAASHPPSQLRLASQSKNDDSRSISGSSAPDVASASNAEHASAILRVFENGAGSGRMMLRATINLTAPDSHAPASPIGLCYVCNRVSAVVDCVCDGVYVCVCRLTFWLWKRFASALPRILQCQRAKAPLPNATCILCRCDHLLPLRPPLAPLLTACQHSQPLISRRSLRSLFPLSSLPWLLSCRYAALTLLSGACFLSLLGDCCLRCLFVCL